LGQALPLPPASGKELSGLTAPAMATSSLRSWPKVWKDTVLAVMLDEVNKELDQELLLYACPDHHGTPAPPCLSCYTYQRASLEGVRAAIPHNDLVHLRRIVVAAIRLLQARKLPADQVIAHHLVRQPICFHDFEYVSWFVMQKLLEAGHIDDPGTSTTSALRHRPPSPPGSSTLYSWSSSCLSTSSMSIRSSAPPMCELSHPPDS